jgi:hypothetical protein
VITFLAALVAFQSAVSAPTESSACSYLAELRKDSALDYDGDGSVSVVFEADLNHISEAANHVRELAWLNPGDFLSSDHRFDAVEVPIVENKGLLVLTRKVDGFNNDSSVGLSDIACGFAKKWNLTVKGWSITFDHEVVAGSFAVEGIR